ncbi:HIT family protein [Leptospira biflexa]|uniref:HIT family protein n=1 Tax=Leptospira biflexa TaxID=172 RepID=UPI0010832997|nr:HIT domain-containing protein [Leptospira biflexa]TGM36846.1 HIT domain-containing protein [Leptospira biflexa]TGM39831.1 HIT domain-containing protein [Leptospira biflexa]TGM54226.1 HIT domain-containing protein [Leptospira biflexa]
MSSYEEHSLRKNLFSIGKLGYAKGDRPNVECILCGVRDKNEIVPNLTIAETDLSIVSINLFPYNPGHIIIFPKRHIIHYLELTDEEALDIHRLTQKTMRILEQQWKVQGFNTGYNLGKNSGGSIPHIHEHIVPRFPNEAGFLDVLSNTRIVIYEPYQMWEDLKKLWVKEEN